MMIYTNPMFHINTLLIHAGIFFREEKYSGCPGKFTSFCFRQGFMYKQHRIIYLSCVIIVFYVGQWV